MIYPTTTGKADGKELRLRTMESVWIQGKLKMWGRWATYSDMPEAVNMFKRVLASGKVTPEDLKKAIDKLRKSGCSSKELEAWINEMHAESRYSRLVFCTDEEGARMDRVISETFRKSQALLNIIKRRYHGRGESKSELARELNEVRPEWSFSTCQRRIDLWLSTAEYSLYLPISDAFNLNSKRFILPFDQKTG